MRAVGLPDGPVAAAEDEMEVSMAESKPADTKTPMTTKDAARIQAKDLFSGGVKPVNFLSC